ncbi:MAG: hypothetical protein AB4057_21435 [Crocosphaera sp.]
MNDYETIDAFDIVDPGIEFDPTNWEDITVLIVFIILIISSFIYVIYESKQEKKKYTHYYNRQTGKVEEIDD